MRELIILQGISGMGKSFVHDALVEKYKSMQGVSIAVCSTDNFWYTEVGDDPKKYDFDMNRLGEAHKWNQQHADKAMKSNIHVVIIDNTNITQKEAQPYINMGKANFYNIRFISIGGDIEVAKKANDQRPEDRKVPEFVIERQSERIQRLKN